METAISRMFQALSDPTRREIVQMLGNGDLSAGEIAAQFAISAPSVSHHLSVLKQAEIVIARRNGQSIVYSLNATVMHDVVAYLMSLFSVGGGRPASPAKENPDA